MSGKKGPSAEPSRLSMERPAGKPPKVDKRKEKKSASRIVPAPNLPAFAYKDANPSRHISHVVGTQSRQGSIEDLAVDKTNERSHSRLSQAGKLASAAPAKGRSLWVWFVTASVFLLLVLVFIVVFGLLKGGDGRSSSTTTTRKQ
ncbi:hypothetical protein V5799_025126 [Amblyomma americanum]|uniref:Uncharacterized protein n=1 Tax=Amblyomma americanum TaxID=6943 RepID=A0AAQ4EAM4_AMBAM